MSKELDIVELARRCAAIEDEDFPGPPSDAAVREFERNHRLRIPAQVRRWLSQTDGLAIGPGGIYGIGGTRDFLKISHYLEIFPHWIKRQWLPIASDGCGNYYVAVLGSAPGEPICFIDVSEDEHSLTYCVASDFEHFIGFLLGEDDRWPFDADYVLTVDPALRALEGSVPMPWDEA
jgi:SMI1 / KNR4 family (SUKH-1)